MTRRTVFAVLLDDRQAQSDLYYRASFRGTLTACRDRNGQTEPVSIVTLTKADYEAAERVEPIKMYSSTGTEMFGSIYRLRGK